MRNEMRRFETNILCLGTYLFIIKSSFYLTKHRLIHFIKIKAQQIIAGLLF
jgi:hypothetical protein